jgi:hypothetical protein
MDFERVYQPGDRIVLRGPRRVALRVDATMPECLLYLPGSLGGEGEFDYIVPYGRAEKETGSAYDPASFAGSSHHVTARPWTGAEPLRPAGAAGGLGDGVPAQQHQQLLAQSL